MERAPVRGIADQMLMKQATARLLISALCIIVFTMQVGFTSAGQLRDTPIIGVVFSSTLSLAKPNQDALRKGLHDLGYIDGSNITIVARFAEGDPSRLPALFKELIALQAHALVVSPTAVNSAMQATTTIPIVCPTLINPVRDGLAGSFAHPGGNVTGLYALATETDAKRLQLAMELIPGLKRAGVVFENVGSVLADANMLRTQAEALGITFHTYGVRNAEDLRVAIANTEKDRVQAVLVFNTPLLLLHRDTLIRSLSHRIPVVSEGRDFAEVGALLTYSADYVDMWRRSARYVDKILRGAKPADMPIEQAVAFELVLNMKTAKTLGVAIPESVLLRADHVIR